ncbi:hypothetical protein LWM68_30095 [Niabella sp. W65]|nr:hypothetical protein [Niabella sp. W65]MCH7366640.1 hypothetical protein [Niabella sp. W65]ULT42353.1 hypothetical protein KRR40_01595 [Niabella sp. I65]
MKRSKIYIAALCIIANSTFLSSCNKFLEEDPLDTKISSQFWKTPADAESAVNGLYFGGCLT